MSPAWETKDFSKPSSSFLCGIPSHHWDNPRFESLDAMLYRAAYVKFPIYKRLTIENDKRYNYKQNDMSIRFSDSEKNCTICFWFVKK